MNRSWICRLSLIGACAAPLAAANLATAQTPPKTEDPARDVAPTNEANNLNRQNDPQNTDRAREENREDRAQQARDNASGRTDHAAHAGAQIDDRTLAAILLIGNQKEVAVNQLAATRAQNAEVKQFAQEMVQAHTQLIGRLAKLAGAQERAHEGGANPFSSQRDPAGAAANNDRERSATEQRADQTANRDRAENRDQLQANQNGQHHERGQGHWQRFELGNSPLVNFDRELADQCLQSTEKFLGQQQGAEFDRWFMALQFVEHMGMRDKLQVAQRHATGELKGLVDQGLQTTDQHIRQIEQVMRQLPQAGTAAQRTSNRPTSTSPQ
jgi:predicted outer membrane protein